MLPPGPSAEFDSNFLGRLQIIGVVIVTFFAVVALSAKVGVVLPWQIPVNQLASDPARAQLALALGGVGGCVALCTCILHCVLQVDDPTSMHL